MTRPIGEAAIAAALAFILSCAGADRAQAEEVGPHWFKVFVPAIPESSGAVWSTLDAARGRTLALAATPGSVGNLYELDSGGAWGRAGQGYPLIGGTQSTNPTSEWWYHPPVFNPVRGRLFSIAGQPFEWDPSTGALEARGLASLGLATGSPLSVAVDPARGRIFVVGTWASGGSPALLESSAATLDSWVVRAAPPGVNGSFKAGAVAVDPVSGLLVMHGGWGTNSRGNMTFLGTLAYDPSTDAWSVFAAGAGPDAASTGRVCGVMAYDPGRRRIVLFGGVSFNEKILADAWELDPVARTWSAVRSPGAIPAGLRGTSLAYDPARGRLVLTGVSAQDQVEVWDYAPLNHAPAIDPVPETTVRAGEALVLAVSTTDADGDKVDLAASNLPSRAIFEASAGTIRWTPQAADAGTYSLTLHASDGVRSMTATARVHVVLDRSAPGADDGFEPNDAMAAASAITGGMTGLYCADDDWFAVRAATPGDLAVRISFRHSEGDLDLEVLGPTGKRNMSGSTADSEEVRIPSAPAGTYWIHVFGFGGARAAYDLSIGGLTSVIGTGRIGGRVAPGSSAPLYAAPRGATLPDRLFAGTSVEVLEVRQVSAMSTYYLVRTTDMLVEVKGWVYGKNVVLD